VRRLDQYIEMNPNEARLTYTRALSSMNGESERSDREFDRAVQLDHAGFGRGRRRPDRDSRRRAGVS
jgi:hypothetical protein